MIGTQVIQILRSVHLLEGLDEPELAEVWAASQLREVGSGSTIMEAGSTGDSMYFFLEGTVDVWPAHSSRQRKTIGSPGGKPLVRLKAGVVSLFGEMAMISNEPRSATITAASDCILYEISRADFTMLCDKSPRLGLKLMRGIANILAERVRKGNDEQIKLWKALSLAAAKEQPGND